jgi:hypothetical protein
MGTLILGVRIFVVIILIVAVLVLAIAVPPGMAVGTAIGIAAIASALVFATLFVDQTDNPKVMLSMLKVTFRRYSVTSSLGITRQSHILFVYLKRIAPDADIGTIAVEGLVAQRDIVLSAATIVVAPAARTPNVWSLSHSAITSPTLRFARPRPAWQIFQKAAGRPRSIAARWNVGGSYHAGRAIGAAVLRS